MASQHLKLTSEKRQKSQRLLTFLEEYRSGGARTAFEKSFTATRRIESPAMDGQLMEEGLSLRVSCSAQTNA